MAGIDLTSRQKSDAMYTARVLDIDSQRGLIQVSFGGIALWLGYMSANFPDIKTGDSVAVMRSAGRYQILRQVFAPL